LPSVPPALQRLRDDAADDVGAAAGSERDDHAHRPLRPLLRCGVGRAEKPCGGGGEQVASREHHFPPSAHGGEPSDAAIIHDVADVLVCKCLVPLSRLLRCPIRDTSPRNMPDRGA